jgi:hypothetical protein
MNTLLKHSGPIKRKNTALTGMHVMPVGDLPGWTQVFTDNFDYDLAEGTITPNGSGFLTTGPGAATVGTKFTFYPDTWNSTHGTKVYPKTVGEPGYPGDWPPIVGKYYPSKVLSFAPTTPDGTAPGVMRIRQHSETIGGVLTALGAVAKPRHPNGIYMNGPYARYAFRMRVLSAKIGATDYALTNNFTTSQNLYHIHVPLSIDSENWPENGEFNHPDCDVNRAIKGTYHPAAPQNESWVYAPTPPMSPFQWHVYETIWEPGRVRFLIDGIAWKDTTDRVPSMEMAIAVFQHEVNWRQPVGNEEAITEVDWVVMYDPA